MRRDPIKVVPYDDRWPTLFEQEKQRIQAALAPWSAGPIEHMGSTSVRGLPAKPIIDMVVTVTSYDAAHDAIGPLAALGWVHAPEADDDAMRRLSFCHPDPSWRTHHLHAIEVARPEWRAWLAFRDHLRTSPEDAAAYADLKSALAAGTVDRAAYRAGKDPFVEAVLRKLRHQAD